MDSDAWDWRKGAWGCEVGNGAWAMGIGRWAVLHGKEGGQVTMRTGQGAREILKKGEGTHVYNGCRCAWVCTRKLKPIPKAGR